jgi:hypothetical protein
MRSVFFHSKIKYTFLFLVGGLFADNDSEKEISSDEPGDHLVNQWLPLGRKS